MTIPFAELDWRTLSRADLDLGLNNSVAVAGSLDLVAGWEKCSGEMRARFPDHLDLRYGPRERTRIDFL
jgi:arylformamidase